MTWNTQDLPKAPRPETSIIEAPERLPRQERAAQLALLTEGTTPESVRRELRDAGLVDDVTWGHWRRRATRDVYAW